MVIDLEGKNFVITGAPARSVKAMDDTVGSAWGRIDGIVNYGALASGLGGKRIQNIDGEVWDRVMAVNARGSGSRPGRASLGCGSRITASS